MRQSTLIPRPQIEPIDGVYRPAADSTLLLEAFSTHGPKPVATVLDLCCGSGIQGIAASLTGHHVEAVDSDRRAVVASRRNALLNGVILPVRHGDLFEPVAGRRFDAILANPPYVPSPKGGAFSSYPWSDGGPDGRVVIDRICEQASSHLTRNGALWLVHSSLADVSRTTRELELRGMHVERIAEREEPFGPLTRERLDLLLAEGLVAPTETFERLVVVRATASN